MKHPNRLLKTLGRIVLGSLLAVELFAWAGILPLDLDFTWRGLIITLVFSWGTAEYVVRLLERNVHSSWSGVLFLTIATSVAIDALGDINHWYSRFEWYDQFAHTAGGIATMVFASWMIFHYLKARHVVLPLRVQFFFALGIATLIGVLYETEEFTEDRLTGSNRFGDAIDTITDLLLNLSGSVAVGILLFGLLYRVHGAPTPLKKATGGESGKQL